MPLQEAKLVAVLGERAPIGDVVRALSRLYDEVRRYETEKAQSVEPMKVKFIGIIPSPFPSSKPWRPSEAV